MICVNRCNSWMSYGFRTLTLSTTFFHHNRASGRVMIKDSVQWNTVWKEFFASSKIWSSTASLTGHLLTLIAPNKNCSWRHFNFLLLSFKEIKVWFFMWILCLAEDSLETSSLIFSEKQWKNIVWMLSAAVVIGALKVNSLSYLESCEQVALTVHTAQVYLSLHWKFCM